MNPTDSAKGCLSSASGLDGAAPIIRRRHYFELHDQPWWPTPLRAFMTNLLIIDWTFPWVKIRRNGRNIVPSFLSLMARVVERFLDELERSGQPVSRIVDLCAGSGGPWPSLRETLQNRGIRVVLSDLYPPPLQAFPWLSPDRAALAKDRANDPKEETNEGRMIQYYAESVDASNAPKRLDGLRSLCGCFHHFRPPLGQAIFQDCIDKRLPVMVIESAARNPVQKVAAIFFMSFLALATPIAFPRKTPWSIWLLTYVIPVTPLCAAFDGTASCFRSYLPSEMLAVAARCRGAETYRWSAGTETSCGLFSLVFLTGRPLTQAELGEADSTDRAPENIQRIETESIAWSKRSRIGRLRCKRKLR